MLLNLLGYLCVGVVLIFTISFLHVLISIGKGYSIDTINKVLNRAISESTTIVSIIWGIFIWPIRIIQFISSQKYLFEAYDQFEKESI